MRRPSRSTSTSVLADPPCPVAATLRADIESVDVVDDYTVKFVHEGPAPVLPRQPRRKPRLLDLFAQDRRSPDADRLRDIAGTGPFKIKEWLGQRDLVLEANPDYNWASSYFTHNGPPKIKTLRIRNAADTDARLVSLETGESHFITLVPGCPCGAPQERPQLQHRLQAGARHAADELHQRQDRAHQPPARTPGHQLRHEQRRDQPSWSTSATSNRPMAHCPRPTSSTTPKSRSCTPSTWRRPRRCSKKPAGGMRTATASPKPMASPT